ncbi:hypothetical protein EV122DRAFT_281314 [Schizophyllum commune]
MPHNRYPMDYTDQHVDTRFDDVEYSDQDRAAFARLANEGYMAWQAPEPLPAGPLPAHTQYQDDGYLGEHDERSYALPQIPQDPRDLRWGLDLTRDFWSQEVAEPALSGDWAAVRQQSDMYVGGYDIRGEPLPAPTAQPQAGVLSSTYDLPPLEDFEFPENPLDGIAEQYLARAQPMVQGADAFSAAERAEGLDDPYADEPDNGLLAGDYEHLAGHDNFDNDEVISIASSHTPIPLTSAASPPSTRKRRTAEQSSVQVQKKAKTRTAAPGPTTTPPSSVTSRSSFRVFIYIEIPQVMSRRRKIVPLPAPKQYGPISVMLTASWKDFIQLVAAALDCQDHSRIQTGSFKWKPLKPKNAEQLPLRDDSGWQCLLESQAARAVRPTNDLTIMVFMAELREPLITVPSATTSYEQEAARTARVHAAEVPEQYSVRAKGSLDEAVAVIANDLLQRYPKHTCPDHPEHHCFRHVATHQHFLLDLKPRRLAWAQRIMAKDPTCDWTKPPLGQSFWKPSDATKKSTGLPAAALIPMTSVNPAPAAPVAAVAPPAPDAAAIAATAVQSVMQLIMPLVAGGQGRRHRSPSPYGRHRHSQSPRSHHRRRSPSPPSPVVDVRSSSPIPEGATEEGFYQFASLNARDRQRLTKMEFTVDVDSSKISKEEWDGAGFREMSWARVTKAHRKYLRSLQ